MRYGTTGMKVSVKLTISTHAVRAKVKQRRVLESSGRLVWRLARHEMDATRSFSVLINDTILK